MRDDMINRLSLFGFAFCASLWPSVLTEQLVQALGEPIVFGARSSVHALRPKTPDEALPNTYSGNYGLAEFPLHTDMANWHAPPRYLLLRCVVGTANVSTIVADPGQIINAIGIDNLSRALMKPRRRVNGRMTLLPIAQRCQDVMLIRWDKKYLQPASRAGKLYATDIERRLKTLPRVPVVLAELGDTLIIDNWRMLHGRSAVGADGQSRYIERVYLSELNA